MAYQGQFSPLLPEISPSTISSPHTTSTTPNFFRDLDQNWYGEAADSIYEETSLPPTPPVKLIEAQIWPTDSIRSHVYRTPESLPSRHESPIHATLVMERPEYIRRRASIRKALKNLGVSEVDSPNDHLRGKIAKAMSHLRSSFFGGHIALPKQRTSRDLASSIAKVLANGLGVHSSTVEQRGEREQAPADYHEILTEQYRDRRQISGQWDYSTDEEEDVAYSFRLVPKPLFWKRTSREEVLDAQRYNAKPPNSARRHRNVGQSAPNLQVDSGSHPFRGLLHKSRGGFPSTKPLTKHWPPKFRLWNTGIPLHPQSTTTSPSNGSETGKVTNPKFKAAASNQTLTTPDLPSQPSPRPQSIEPRSEMRDPRSTEEFLRQWGEEIDAWSLNIFDEPNIETSGDENSVAAKLRRALDFLSPIRQQTAKWRERQRQQRRDDLKAGIRVVGEADPLHDIDFVQRNDRLNFTGQRF